MFLLRSLLGCAWVCERLLGTTVGAFVAAVAMLPGCAVCLVSRPRGLVGRRAASIQPVFLHIYKLHHTLKHSSANTQRRREPPIAPETQTKRRSRQHSQVARPGPTQSYQKLLRWCFRSATLDATANRQLMSGS